MNFSEHLSQWLTRHPLKEPSETDRSRYTAEVMRRVKDTAADHAGAAVPFWARWAWPQAGLSLAAAAAALAVAVWGVQTNSVQLAERRIAQEAGLLAQLDEPVNGAVEPDLAEEAAELDEEEMLVLAEAQPAGDAWVSETLQLLEALDEVPDEDASPDGKSEEEWLDELELLDEGEIAAAS